MNKPWKAVTIYDIALKIGKSPSTVSRALNDHPMIKDQTKNLVRKTAKELGFEPDNRTGQHIAHGVNAIGVIVPFLNKDGMADMVTSILDTVAKAGYDVIISQSMDSAKREAELLRNMFTRKIKGLLICLAAEKKEPFQFAKYQQFNIPVCSFFRTLDDSYGGKIYINNQTASYKLTAHLIAEGCIKIGYVIGQSNTQAFSDRIIGYMAALKDHKIAFSKDLIFHTTMNVSGGEIIARKIAESRNSVDGLIFSDDSCAIGCMNTLKQYGKLIPEDISIACFNSTGAELLAHPPLTAIDYSHHQIGKLAALQLINEIKSEQTQQRQPFSLEVGHQLVIRSSSQKKTSIELQSTMDK